MAELCLLKNPKIDILPHNGFIYFTPLQYQYDLCEPLLATEADSLGSPPLSLVTRQRMGFLPGSFLFFQK